MNITYYPDVDALSIELTAGPAANVTEVNWRTQLNVDAQERVVSMLLSGVSEYMDPDDLAQYIQLDGQPAAQQAPPVFTTEEAAQALGRSVQWVKACALDQGIGQVKRQASRVRQFTGADLVALRQLIKYKKAGDDRLQPASH